MNRIFIWTAIKKTLKKRIFIVPMILVICLIGVMYQVTCNTEKQANDVALLSSNLQSLEAQSKVVKPDANLAKTTKTQLATMKAATVEYHKHEWRKAAKNLILLNQMAKAAAKNNGEVIQNDPVIQIADNTLAYAAKHNVNPDDPSISAQGLPFSLKLLSFAFSMVMVPMLIFMLSNFFADKFQDKKNMDILFPQKTKICERNRFIAATLLFLAVYLMIVGFSLVIGTLVNGLGDVHFPLYYIVENKVGQLTVGGTLLQTVILQFLSCTGVIALLQLMNNVTKNQILSILLTMLITVPQIVAPIVLPVFNKVMHLIPGAYIATPNIIDTAWANQTHNYQLTFVNGILVSSVYLVALLLANYGYTQNAGRGLFVKVQRTLSVR